MIVHYLKVDDNGNISVYYDGDYREVATVTPTAKKAPVLESNGFLPVKYMEGDFGGGFATLSLPTPDTSCIVLVRDTNATTPGVRLYVYAGNEWKYVDLS